MAKTSRIYLVFALELVLIVAVGVLAYIHTDQLITANRSAALTHEVLERLEVVLSLLKDAETGQRGFVLTGEERYLEPYDVAVGRIRQETDSLMALAGDDSRNQSSLQRLQKLSDAKLAELEETIRLRRTSGLQATLPVILTDRGKKIMDEIRSVLAEIKARENLRMDERNRAATARANSVLRTIVLWTPLSLLILTATVVWLTGTARFEAATARRGPAGTRWIALFRYVLAVALPAGATVVQLRLNDLVGSLPYFIIFYPTVLLVAILAGGGPAFVAIVVSALAVKYWFMPRIGSFQFEALRDIATLMIFLGVNSFVCLIAVRMQRYQWVEAVRAAQEEELALLDLGNLLSLDPDHRIVHWSEGCRRLYGFGPEEVRGRLTHELLQTRIAQPLEQIHAALFDSGHWEGRATRRRKDGSEVVVAILWALRRDAQGRPTAILEVSTDLTEQESAGRAIRRQAALIDLSPDATIVRRLDGTITFWSRGAEAIYGWAKDQAIGRSTHALFGTRYPEPLEQIHDQLKRTGRWSGELIHWTKDGRDVVVESRWLAEFDAKGEVAAILESNVDLTDRKEAEIRIRRLNETLEQRVDERTKDLAVAEERFRGAFDVASIGMALVAPDGRWLRVNGALCRMVGYSEDELLGMTFQDITHPDDLEAEIAEMRGLLGGEIPTYQSEKRYLHKDGRAVWIVLSVSLVRDAAGLPLHFVCQIADITERKRAEQEIRLLNEQLERRVQDRTAQLEAANKELESFAYSVSHDLRAPLRAIDGFAQILMNEHAPALAYEPHRLLERVSDSSRKMGRLIDDLLRFSRLGRQVVALKPVDTADLVRQCLDDLAAERAGRQVEIAVGELPPCWADPALLRQVWLNLLANALKFTRARDPARVEVGSSTQDGETVYFVRDNGVGFDMAYADKLFGVFQRLHRQEDYEGTGVGLALVQRILHRHGGRAWAEAEPGRGATFSFTLGRSDTDA